MTTTLVALPVETRETVLAAIDSVLRDARTGYVQSSGGPSNYVDFHITAAQDVRRQIAGVSELDGVLLVELSMQEIEALGKILRNSVLVRKSIEAKKLALIARKSIGAGEVSEAE